MDNSSRQLSGLKTHNVTATKPPVISGAKVKRHFRRAPDHNSEKIIISTSSYLAKNGTSNRNHRNWSMEECIGTLRAWICRNRKNQGGNTTPSISLTIRIKIIHLRHAHSGF